MDLIGGIHDNLSLHVLLPFTRMQRSARSATRPTQQAFYNGVRFRKDASSWSEAQRTDWMLTRLREISRRAYEETEYYRSLFDQIDQAGPSLLSSSVASDQMRKDRTGGSTGVPTELWLGPNERGWRDSGMEYFFELLGVPEGTRTALLWGHHLDPKKADTLRE